jgi:hypothetical protein
VADHGTALLFDPAARTRRPDTLLGNKIALAFCRLVAYKAGRFAASADKTLRDLILAAETNESGLFALIQLARGKSIAGAAILPKLDMRKIRRKDVPSDLTKNLGSIGRFEGCFVYGTENSEIFIIGHMINELLDPPL